MSSLNNHLKELFGSNEFAGQRKVIISSAGTAKRNNLKQYIESNDVLYKEVLPNPRLNQLIQFLRVIQLTPKDIIVGIGGSSQGSKAVSHILNQKKCKNARPLFFPS